MRVSVTRDATRVPVPATAVEISENEKLGKVSATYVSQSSCPHDCPMRDKGCYAEQGYAGITTARLNQSDERNAARLAYAEARAIDGLSGRRLLRLHVVGDCRTTAAAKIVGAAAARYAARGLKPRRGRKAWGYTHAWRRIARSAFGRHASMLASCETLADAKTAMRRGYAAAVVVPDFPRHGAYQQDGVTVLPCPAQTRGVQCADCGLCRDDGRLKRAKIVIAFAAHGSGKGMVRKTLLSLPTV